ncbi:MAG: hypothetical protein E6K80_00365 [Candidatus Eisenbacteria bacterium]|uniref:Uncharacterized protein n=1 Tax=Eiseniibacteriota bacterium TaxID=2212470 RepID=A0A538UBY1_UNCEI|nr:MAG: hypothetical protein E6K80_00365 [Candidatus Eisenbacteria bacterium]
MLEERLGKVVETYVPPCNLGDRSTARALLEAGYQRVLSERALPACALPCVRSDFYGRSNGYDYALRPDIITLHVTWEWDLVRQGDSQLDRLLDHLSERARAERERGERLGAIVGSRNGTR